MTFIKSFYKLATAFTVKSSELFFKTNQKNVKFLIY